MKPKNVLWLALVAVLITTPLPTNARERPSKETDIINLIDPGTRYVDVQSLKGDLYISDWGKASITGSIYARTAERTQVTCKLKRYLNGSWVTYKTWTNEENFNVCSVLEDYYVPSGYSYKLFVYGYAWVDDVLVDEPIYITGTVYY